MTETPAPYTADPPPDGPTPLTPGAPTPYTERLDNATLHAWVTAATDIFAGLLTGSTMPPNHPREQAHIPTVLLPRDARERITALLAGPLPPDPLVGEFNRVLRMLERVAAERDVLKAQAGAVTRHLPLRVGGTLTAGLVDAIRALKGAPHAE